MAQFLKFLGVYGALIGTAAMLVGFVWLLAYYSGRIRRLEARVEELNQALCARLERASEESKADMLKQRRLFTESMAGLSESLTRAMGLISPPERED